MTSKIISVKDTTVTTYEDGSITNTYHLTNKKLASLSEAMGYLEEQQKLLGGEIAYMHFGKNYLTREELDNGTTQTFYINFDLVTKS